MKLIAKNLLETNELRISKINKILLKNGLLYITDEENNTCTLSTCECIIRILNDDDERGKIS